jgi:hypothetical protein
MNKYNHLIGNHINSREVRAANIMDVWPTVTGRGIITGFCDGDNVPSNAVLIDWNSNEPDDSGYTVVDGDNGFEAILE